MAICIVHWWVQSVPAWQWQESSGLQASRRAVCPVLFCRNSVLRRWFVYDVGGHFTGRKNGARFHPWWRPRRRSNCCAICWRYSSGPCIALWRLHRGRLPFDAWQSRCHTARITRQFMDEVGIQTMDWPALSPDLNPIEHLWDELKRKVRARNPAPTSIGELKTALEEEWERLPQELVKKLIRSMKNRLRSVIQARGGNTKYWLNKFWLKNIHFLFYLNLNQPNIYFNYHHFCCVSIQTWLI